MGRIDDPAKQKALDSIGLKAKKIIAKRNIRLSKFFDHS